MAATGVGRRPFRAGILAAGDQLDVTRGEFHLGVGNAALAFGDDQHRGQRRSKGRGGANPELIEEGHLGIAAAADRTKTIAYEPRSRTPRP